MYVYGARQRTTAEVQWMCVSCLLLLLCYTVAAGAYRLDDAVPASTVSLASGHRQTTSSRVDRIGVSTLQKLEPSAENTSYLLELHLEQDTEAIVHVHSLLYYHHYW